MSTEQQSGQQTYLSVEAMIEGEGLGNEVRNEFYKCQQRKKDIEEAFREHYGNSGHDPDLGAEEVFSTGYLAGAASERERVLGEVD